MYGGTVLINNIRKKYLCGLIIFTIITTLTACKNIQSEPSHENITVNSLNTNNRLPEAKREEPILLDSWVGDYIFTEYIEAKDYTKFYEVFISKKNNSYIAKIKTEDTHVGVYSYVEAKIKGDNTNISFIFSNYLSGVTNTNKPYNSGDNLLAFTKTDTGIITHWDKIVPNNDFNKIDGEYFKIRENSEGFLGHWYTSIPNTGGNSTTIEVKEMSDKSVSFHLYFCRTYYYDGIDIKLENNIAKFDDNANDYRTTGTIEFSDKSVIVNIEETELPILDTGKTVFNYKVSEFKPIKITPNNGATQVDLEKGIEMVFDRKIKKNKFSAIIRKANLSEGSDYEFIEMRTEKKGNKLIFLPDYDSMKWHNKIIEAGLKYELYIGEGTLIDEIGNINSELLLEFTTKE